MTQHILLLEKLKDGEEEIAYALVWPGDEPRIICELATYPNQKRTEYLFSYTDCDGKTTHYSRKLTTRTKEGAENLIKKLLTQKVDWMGRTLQAELCLLDNT